MPEKDYVIEAKNLVKSYGKTEVLKGIDLQVERGTMLALLGPNGAGKSTTFNIITQLISRSGGTVELGGRSIDSHDKFSIYKDCGVKILKCRLQNKTFVVICRTAAAVPRRWQGSQEVNRHRTNRLMANCRYLKVRKISRMVS